MKKIIKKIKIIIFIVLNSLISFTSKAYADDKFINFDDYEPGAIENGGKIKEIGNIIIGGIQFIGSIVSVIVLIIIGIKFILGSAEEKAEYKQSLMPYIIGAVMLFAITNLLAIISSVIN